MFVVLDQIPGACPSGFWFTDIEEFPLSFLGNWSWRFWGIYATVFGPFGLSFLRNLNCP